MITTYTSRFNDFEKEYRGLAADAKPTEDVPNGSIFVEIDTGKVYFYNAEGETWVEQFSFQG